MRVKEKCHLNAKYKKILVQFMWIFLVGFYGCYSSCICCKFCSCNLFVCQLSTCHIVKDALFIFFELSFVGFWLFFYCRCGWVGKLHCLEWNYITSSSRKFAMVTFEKQKTFMATMKDCSQMEDWNNHHCEEKQRL
jgi:hypothetical protein